MRANEPMAMRAQSIDRASRELETEPPVWGVLARITSAASIVTGTGSYRWLYQWEEIQVGAAPNYLPTLKSGGITGSAVSVSELGNTLTAVAYGVLLANIAAGFAPVRIPNQTPVWIVPHRQTDGTLLWLIVATQAIDGVCP
jgi:hypothetical protein